MENAHNNTVHVDENFRNFMKRYKKCMFIESRQTCEYVIWDGHNQKELSAFCNVNVSFYDEGKTPYISYRYNPTRVKRYEPKVGDYVVKNINTGEVRVISKEEFDNHCVDIIEYDPSISDISCNE